MTDPFADDEATYTVLVNDGGHRSLWPAHLDAPAGWSVVHGPSTRQACLTHVASQPSGPPARHHTGAAGAAPGDATGRA